MEVAQAREQPRARLDEGGGGGAKVTMKARTSYTRWGTRVGKREEERGDGVGRERETTEKDTK